jgi:hypothetical protein
METLRELGFRENWIYETIVTTRDNGKVNSAPMGVWTDDFKRINLEVYKKTVTCDNILKKKDFVINFPGDIEVFYKSMLNSFTLENSDAFLEMRVAEIRNLEDRVRITSDIIKAWIREKPRLVNRAEALTLESLIAYSKLRFVSGKERGVLEDRIKENHRIICKSAPASIFQKLVQKLLGSQ